LRAGGETTQLKSHLSRSPACKLNCTHAFAASVPIGKISEMNDEPKTTVESRCLAKPVTDAFYFLGLPGFTAELEGDIARHTGTVGEAGLSFKANLEAALSVASIPFLMAHQGATSQRFHSLLTAERIRARGSETPEDEEEVMRRVTAKATERFDAEMITVEGSSMLREDTLRRLERARELADFGRAAEELLNETLVMIWGAFEVLVSDVVRAKLNLDPSSAVKLVTSEPVRKHFRKDVSIETLAGLGFNLNRAMGTCC
jgi:hypothetical protein